MIRRATPAQPRDRLWESEFSRGGLLLMTFGGKGWQTTPPALRVTEWVGLEPLEVAARGLRASQAQGSGLVGDQRDPSFRQGAGQRRFIQLGFPR